MNERAFKSINESREAIVDYIDYYNNKRVLKNKIKGLISLYNTELNLCLGGNCLTFWGQYTNGNLQIDGKQSKTLENPLVTRDLQRPRHVK